MAWARRSQKLSRCHLEIEAWERQLSHSFKEEARTPPQRNSRWVEATTLTLLETSTLGALLRP